MRYYYYYSYYYYSYYYYSYYYQDARMHGLLLLLGGRTTPILGYWNYT